jgi:hypothetical protein
MERIDRPQYGSQPSSTPPSRIAHEPLPRRMEELLERLQILEGDEVQHWTS